MASEPERDPQKFQPEDRKRQYTQGEYLGMGAALGIALGVALSLAVDNFAFVGVGVAIGTALGAAFAQDATE